MRPNLNSLRSYIGRNVNLHLRDGTTIINVVVTGLKRNNHGRGATLYYRTPENAREEIPLRDLAWVDQLNPHLFPRPKR